MSLYPGTDRNVLVIASRTIAAVITLALLIGAVAAAPARAQTGVQWGVLLGYEFGVPLALSRGAGTINDQPVRGDGISYDNTLRLSGSLQFPALFDDGVGLSAYLSLIQGEGLYRSDFESDREFDPITGTIVPSRYQFRLASVVKGLDLDLRLRWALSEHLAFEPGLWLAAPGSASFTTTMRKLGPLPAGSGVRDTLVSETTGTGPLRAGLALGGSLRIPFNDFIQLQTGLHARVDVGALDLGARALSVGGGLGVIFGDFSFPADTPIAALPPVPLPDTPQVDTPRVDPPRDTVPPTPPALAASIDIFSLGPGGQPVQGATIASHLIRQRRQTPFPAAIFFESDSAISPSRYLRSTREEAKRFSLAALARLSHYQVYCRALDILGLRLSEHPEASLTLTGTASSDEPAVLARERAVSVRDYLRDVWGIDASRIVVKSDPRARREDRTGLDRSVRLESSLPAVTAPVTVEWRARTFQLPPLDIQPAIRAQAGVRVWEVTVRQGGQVVTQYSNRPGDRGSTDLALHIPDDLADPSLPPLVAELAVTDSAGASTSVRDTLALVIALDPSNPDSRELGERSAYLLPAPGGGVPEFQRGGSAVLREIAATVRAGDRVTVSDRSGRYGAEVADGLRRLLRATGARVDLRRDDADPGYPAGPEGSLLAAGVTVLVEHGLVDSAGRQ
jgi:hypothetical protein